MKNDANIKLHQKLHDNDNPQEMPRSIECIRIAFSLAHVPFQDCMECRCVQLRFLTNQDRSPTFVAQLYELDEIRAGIKKAMESITQNKWNSGSSKSKITLDTHYPCRCGQRVDSITSQIQDHTHDNEESINESRIEDVEGHQYRVAIHSITRLTSVRDNQKLYSFIKQKIELEPEVDDATVNKQKENPSVLDKNSFLQLVNPDIIKKKEADAIANSENRNRNDDSETKLRKQETELKKQPVTSLLEYNTRLPFMEVNGMIQVQTRAIVKQAGMKTGLYPTDMQRALTADEVIEIAQEFDKELHEEIDNIAQKVSADAKKVMEKQYQNVKGIFDKLQERLKEWPGAFFCGPDVGIVDLYWFVIVVMLKSGEIIGFPVNFLEDQEILETWYNEVAKLHEIQDQQDQWQNKQKDDEY